MSSHSLDPYHVRISAADVEGSLTNPDSPPLTCHPKLRAQRPVFLLTTFVPRAMPPVTIASQRKQPCSGCRSRKKRCDVGLSPFRPENSAYWPPLRLVSFRLLRVLPSCPSLPWSNINNTIPSPDCTPVLLQLSEVGHRMRLHKSDSGCQKTIRSNFQ